jgi:hypothetical protein
MISPATPPLFPLYLAPIELFMETEDRPEHPMAFVIELRLSGSIDREAFIASLSGALIRHPFLNALVKRRKKNQLCWVSAKELGPRVDWSDDDRPIELPPEGEAIDLDSEVGLRVWVRRGGSEARVTLQFHHACCDGVGAYRFIGDLLALYGELTAADGAERPTLAPLDVTRLRTRSRGVLDVALSGERFRLARLAVREGLEVVAARATELAPARKENGIRYSPFPSVQSVTFERSVHDQLRDAAMRHGAMLNDLLLAELFLTARDWNVRKTGAAGRKLRIMMPTDLRTTDDYETPAVNKVAYTFLNRKPRELERPEVLLQSIRRETAEIKNARRGVRFADMVAGGFAVKGLMPLLLSIPFCMATTLLSNVGDPSRRFTARFPRSKGRIVCGNLILEEITGSPPLRRKTRATISAFAYNRRLTLSARCDPFTFTPADTQEFLDLYAARLQSHVAAPEAPAPLARAAV